MLRSKILLVEDDKCFADSFEIVFRLRQVQVVWASTGAKAIARYKEDPRGFAVVVMDYKLPDLTGAEVVQQLRRINPEQEFLFSTGLKTLETFTDMLETGTNGFFVKGTSTEVMYEKVFACIKKYQSRNRIIGLDNYEMSQAEAELKMAGFTSRSRQMYALLRQINKYRDSKYPILIIGETGVGKELVARALVPKGKTLIAVNCPAYIDKENLLESELFGHVKGA